MSFIKHFNFCLLALAAQLLASPTSEDPYFGGTLLSTIPENIPPGTWYFEPYLYATRQTGTYTPHWSRSSKPQFTSVQIQWEIETGITPWLDIAFYPNFYYTHSSFLIGDTQLALGFQLFSEQKSSPAFRVIFQESFPTGKFDRLKSPSQATGSGSYQTWISAVLYKTVIPCTLNLSVDYIISSNVSPHGLNIYNTQRSFHPGAQLITNFGIEYSITQHTVLGLDLHHKHQNSSSQTSSLEQFSLAPCIEYNPSPNLTFEAGPWFTIAGRNSSIFTSAIFTAYWQF